jgi:hypothetical protein
MEKSPTNASGEPWSEFDRQVRKALVATFGDVQPPESAWYRIVRRAGRLDRAAYALERREEPILVT